MMNVTTIVGLGLGLALAALSAPASANPGHKYLTSLKEQDRNAWLSELLSKMPGSCIVQRNFFRGFDAQGAALWSAGCANKKAYAIKVLGDAKGSTRILDCQVLLDRAKDDCFTKL